MYVAVVVFDGFDNLDAIGPFEVFGHAREGGADLSVDLCSVTPQSVVESNHGLRIEPSRSLLDRSGSVAIDPDLVVVPGGGWRSDRQDGVRAVVDRGELPSAISTLAERESTVASVCTGAMVLASAGLLTDRPAITHHSAIDDLREAGATVTEARVVDDGDILTAGGVTSGIDLAIHLVNRTFGGSLASDVARVMEYDATAAHVVTD